jgi:hypothetical protein
MRKKEPTLNDVLDAWRKVKLGSSCSPHSTHGDLLLSRPYFQGVVQQHMERMRSIKKRNSPYRKPTKEELSAIRVTRRWLEFGDYP